MTTRKAELATADGGREAVRCRAAAAEQKVQDQLAAKKTALKGKEAQIAQLEKEEAARQAALAAEARKAAEDARKAREAAAARPGRPRRPPTHGDDQPRPQPHDDTSHTTATTGHTGTTGRTTTTKRTTTTARPTTTTTDPPSSGGTTGGDVVDYALKFLGTPYVWAGSTPSGFDCSGFVMYVYRHFGISLPHSSSMQSGYG